MHNEKWLWVACKHHAINILKNTEEWTEIHLKCADELIDEN